MTNPENDEPGQHGAGLRDEQLEELADELHDTICRLLDGLQTVQWVVGQMQELEDRSVKVMNSESDELRQRWADEAWELIRNSWGVMA